MGNNLCFQNGESSQFPRLLIQKQIGECQVLLTAGPVEKEDVDCLVVPTDCQFSNLKPKLRPSFIPQNGQCIFSAATKKTRNQILAVVDESIVTSDKNCEEKQTIYEAVQGALKLADQRQMKSVGFPVLNSIDYATSATIMLLAIKFSLTEYRFNTLQKIVITLDVLLQIYYQHIEQISSFKWVFQKAFDIEIHKRQGSSYESSIGSQCETQEFLNRKSNREQETP